MKMIKILLMMFACIVFINQTTYAYDEKTYEVIKDGEPGWVVTNTHGEPHRIVFNVLIQDKIARPGNKFQYSFYCTDGKFPGDNFGRMVYNYSIVNLDDCKDLAGGKLFVREFGLQDGTYNFFASGYEMIPFDFSKIYSLMHFKTMDQSLKWEKKHLCKTFKKGTKETTRIFLMYGDQKWKEESYKKFSAYASKRVAEVEENNNSTSEDVSVSVESNETQSKETIKSKFDEISSASENINKGVEKTQSIIPYVALVIAVIVIVIGVILKLRR